MSQMLNQIVHPAGFYGWFSNSYWIFSGIAHGLIILVIGRILIYGYKQHSYLYQFEDKSKTLDNWIKFLLPYVRKFHLHKYRMFIAKNLGRAGNAQNWDSDHFIASQLIYGGAAFFISYIFFGILLDLSFFITIVFTILAISLPVLKLHDVASKRFMSCNKDLPYFIDYLTLAMGAGLDFNHGLSAVVEDASDSPLAQEFGVVLRNMKLGMTKEEALLDMESKMDSPALKLFVQTIVQAIKLGTDVVQTLIVMSETLQQKRFQAAEEMAGKISVRMMIPLMCFVLPSVMIILLGPMILSSPIFH